MAILENRNHYYAKDNVDRVLDDVLNNTKDGKISQSDINRVSVTAQVQSGIDRYREKASQMTEYQLENEAHDSARLG